MEDKLINLQAMVSEKDINKATKWVKKKMGLSDVDHLSRNKVISYLLRNVGK